MRSMAKTRTETHDANSLATLLDRLDEINQSLTEAATILARVPGSTIEVTGGRGLWGTARHPGAIPRLQQFAGDAIKKARLQEAIAKRKKR